MQNQIETTNVKLLPGDLAIWFFIFMELLAFGVFFLVYSYIRMENLEMFNHYQKTLNIWIGLLNTLLLITSSYFVVRSIKSIKQNDVNGCANWLLLAISGGIGFVALKLFEYQDKIEQGISLDTNTFYMFYLSLTFFHFLHVVLGLIILTAIVMWTWQGKYSAEDHVGIESGASYWHMVDLVWIILFPLVYVIR